MADNVTLSVKVPREDVTTLSELAEQADRSLSAEVRIAIREHNEKEKRNGNGNA